ncbi:hypothetical protein BCR32DRAFT_308370 [Anaeromyces robustus]|uniref:Nucleoporin Nup54 alpha-helical domain-containing protein n=1 Tax=Anaeromyces robustus TaxID=1754192 RepID=A0A1Y1XC69_9FUNG|nr:hypothetical protein BCR32DRAFT_308370 [Anaeromyces robustus]|eukprot:ORX83339.1 hypothetical protein BCR32DRAFT_308370 [Anaeromyces robustus]
MESEEVKNEISKLKFGINEIKEQNVDIKNEISELKTSINELKNLLTTVINTQNEQNKFNNNINKSGNVSSSSFNNQIGGLFGKVSSSSSNNQIGGLFGKVSSSSSNNQTGGLFGKVSSSSSNNQTGGLFGNTSSSSSNNQKGGLFGNTSSSNNQTGGLFGNSSSSSSNNQTGGLFGKGSSSSSNNQTGGLFGNASSSNNQTTGLFGNASSSNNQTTGLFGNASSSNNQTTGLFGNASSSNNQTTGLFGNASRILESSSNDISLSNNQTKDISNNDEDKVRYDPRIKFIIEELNICKFDPIKIPNDFKPEKGLDDFYHRLINIVKELDKLYEYLVVFEFEKEDLLKVIEAYYKKRIFSNISCENNETNEAIKRLINRYYIICDYLSEVHKQRKNLEEEQRRILQNIKINNRRLPSNALRITNRFYLKYDKCFNFNSSSRNDGYKVIDLSLKESFENIIDTHLKIFRIINKYPNFSYLFNKSKRIKNFTLYKLEDMIPIDCRSIINHLKELDESQFYEYEYTLGNPKAFYNYDI